MAHGRRYGKKGGVKPRPYISRRRGRACPYPYFLCAYLLFCIFLAGCAPRNISAKAAPASVPPGELLAPGVMHRAIATGPNAGIDVIDVDLDAAQARWAIQTGGVAMANGQVVGQAYTPREWLTREGGLAAVNGGYFGEYEDVQERKDFVGLLVQKGRVRHAAPPLMGQGSAAIARGRYIRSAFGLTAAGRPRIAWAATEPGHPQVLKAYSGPMGRQVFGWRVAQAVGCGPTLIAGGKVVVTDSQERLVSRGLLPRTFVAYDRVAGQPQHLIVGMASASDFPALANWISDYFSRYDKTRAEAAMCLDGGASTQMTYKLAGSLQSPRETDVTVPDALVLLPGR